MAVRYRLSRGESENRGDRSLTKAKSTGEQCACAGSIIGTKRLQVNRRALSLSRRARARVRLISGETAGPLIVIARVSIRDLFSLTDNNDNRARARSPELRKHAPDAKGAIARHQLT